MKQIEELHKHDHISIWTERERERERERWLRGTARDDGVGERRELRNGFRGKGNGIGIGIGFGFGFVAIQKWKRFQFHFEHPWRWRNLLFLLLHHQFLHFLLHFSLFLSYSFLFTFNSIHPRQSQMPFSIFWVLRERWDIPFFLSEKQMGPGRVVQKIQPTLDWILCKM